MGGLEAERLLDELDGLGIVLELHGDGLRFRPRGALPDHLLKRLKSDKAAVCEALRTRGRSADQRGRLIVPTAPLVPPQLWDSDPPSRRCAGCRGSGFHRVAGGPAWICDRCHPGAGPSAWVELHEALEPSVFEQQSRLAPKVKSDVTGKGRG
jgi:hypothetical protein